MLRKRLSLREVEQALPSIELTDERGEARLARLRRQLPQICTQWERLSFLRLNKKGHERRGLFLSSLIRGVYLGRSYRWGAPSQDAQDHSMLAAVRDVTGLFEDLHTTRKYAALHHAIRNGVLERQFAQCCGLPHQINSFVFCTPKTKNGQQVRSLALDYKLLATIADEVELYVSGAKDTLLYRLKCLEVYNAYSPDPFPTTFDLFQEKIDQLVDHAGDKYQCLIFRTVTTSGTRP